MLTAESHRHPHQLQYRHLVVLQVGQCGNQLGAALFDAIDAKCHSLPSKQAHLLRNAFFTFHDNDKPFTARAICLDTEGKVLKSLKQEQQRHHSWQYASDNCFAERIGAGNNWALGYHHHGPVLFERAKQNILRAIYGASSATNNHEKSFGGFLILHSLAGGTGSGVGAYVTEAVRRLFGTRFPIINQVIWPYAAGEVAVQHLNIMLTLTRLNRVSDIILYAQNDQLYQICVERWHLTSIGLDQLNQCFVQALLLWLMPALLCDPKSLEGAHLRQRNMEPLMDLVRCTVFNSCRLVTFKWVPQSSPSMKDYAAKDLWHGLARYLNQMIKFDVATDNERTRVNDSSSVHVLKWMVIVRGIGTHEWIESIQDINGPFQTLVGKNKIRPILVTMESKKEQRSILCAVNSSACLSLLEKTLFRCHSLLSANAFVMHYEKYGCDRPFLLQSMHDFIQCTAFDFIFFSFLLVLSAYARCKV